jgi:signal transduction histidine kinase
MLRWPRPTVRLRLTLTYTALFTVTGATLLGVSYLLVQHREKGPRTAVQIICTKKNANGQPESTIVGSSGTGSQPVVLSQTNCSSAVGALYYQAGGVGSGSIARSGSASGKLITPPVGLPATIPGPTAAEVGRLTAAVKESQAHALDSFKLGSALALGVLAIVSFGLSWWMAGRVLRPVHRITDAARSLSERTLHARINMQGPDDELKQLADTFDAMLGRLDRAFHSQRRFVANASHELRTPLATERVLIDEALANGSARPEELRSILEQLRTNSEETERLIDALLLLARSERGIERWSPADLSDVVSSVIEQSTMEAALAGVTVAADVEPAAVNGDRGLLERLAGNLVENAIRHNVAGGSVSITTRQHFDTALLEVVNTGPQLDPAAVASLVEPFRRVGPDRSSDHGGVGLGLSIVNAIVSAHRGALFISARQQGGLEVRVQLPLLDAAASRRLSGRVGVSAAGRDNDSGSAFLSHDPVVGVPVLMRSTGGPEDLTQQ